MSLSALARLKLLFGMADAGVAQEIADAIDASTVGTSVLGQNNVWTGTNKFAATTLTGLLEELPADGLTAGSGGGQGNALALTAQINRITTVAAAGDSVELPPAAVGLAIVVENAAAANNMNVLGNGTDTINGVAYATGVYLPAGKVGVYYCTTAGAWQSAGGGLEQFALKTLSGATDAVPPHQPGTYIVTYAGVDAMTLAAPTSGADDGIIVRVKSGGAHAHTITATGLIQCGANYVNVATFAAYAGAGLTLMAYQAKWIVIDQVGVTFS